MKVALLVMTAVLNLFYWSGEGEKIASIKKKEQLEQSAIRQKPPKLAVTIGKIPINVFLSGYGWSYKDSNGDWMTVETHAIEPTSVKKIEKAPVVEVGAKMEFIFETAPQSFEAFLLESEIGLKGELSEISTGELKGMASFQVIAEWEQGRGSYLFYVDFQ